MMQVPENLRDFRALPLGCGPEWRVQLALYNLEPQRLAFLVPAVLKRWPEASRHALLSLRLAEFLLFLLFQGRVGSEEGRAPFPAAQLTLQQRNVLKLFVQNRSTRYDSSFWQLLRSYGFPNSAEALASYLR